MNKKFEQGLAEYGLTVNGNNAYGVVKCYEVNATVNQRDMYYPMTVHISCYATDAQRADISAALKNRKDIKGLKSVSDFGVTLRLTDITAGRLIKRFPEIMNWILGMLEANGALGAQHCPHCGKQLGAGAQKCDVEGMTVTLDSDCVGAVNAAIDNRNADFAAAPNNYLRGFLGALIGGIVGAALVVVFYLLNFVSVVSGIAAVALGGFLYQKFGGKPNKMMILIVAVTSLVFLIGALLITYIVAARIAADDAGLYAMSAIEVLKFVMENDPDFKSAFIYDLMLVIVFALLGVGVYAWQLMKNVKKAGKQNRITAQPGAPAQQPVAANPEPADAPAESAGTEEVKQVGEDTENQKSDVDKTE